MGHLKLVGNADFAINQLSAQHLSVLSLSPNRNEDRHYKFVSKADHASYSTLTVIVVMHLLGFLWLINAKPLPPKVKEPVTPMLVSLVTNPAPEPELVSIIPPPQPVIKKIKPVVKKVILHKEPVLEPQVAEPEVAQPVAMAEMTPAPVVAAKVPEVVELPAPKVEPAPVIEPPRFGAAYLNNPAPDYPPLSRRLGEEGRVLLRVLVSEEGLAETVQIEKTSGSAKLDQAAMQAVKKWSFIPAKKSNQPISAYVLVPVKFSLQS